MSKFFDNYMSHNEKIEICKRTRKAAKDAFLKVLKDVLSKNSSPSEIEIRDLWLSELRKNESIFKDGWYAPPPHGIAVLIGTDKDGAKSRLNYKSLRPEEMWPRKDIRLNTENGIMYVYASPFDKDSGIIGDFGMTVYFGKDKEIINHLVSCYDIVKQVYNFVRSDVTFSEVASRLKAIISTRGLNNEIECMTDPSSADDVGHTIPFIDEELTTEENQTIMQGNYDMIKKTISEKRIFVRASSDRPVKNGMAFTIEPRPKIIDNPRIPMISFHSICAIRENGEKELIANFDEIFELVGMGYMK